MVRDGRRYGSSKIAVSGRAAMLLCTLAACSTGTSSTVAASSAPAPAASTSAGMTAATARASATSAVTPFLSSWTPHLTPPAATRLT
ncbi:MAG TPA: hypothetical protein VI248_20635 [Kineosporiaceae bacterium]